MHIRFAFRCFEVDVMTSSRPIETLRIFDYKFNSLSFTIEKANAS